MKRKLIRHGVSSLTVSLPIKWIEDNKLKKGDEVELLEQEGKISIFTEKNVEESNIEIDVSRKTGMIRKMIGATYKAGYEEIKIKFETSEELKVIQDLVANHFSGFEIMEKSKNYIILKNIMESNFLEFDTILKRFF